MAEKAFTTFQVAKICGVFPTTVINWVNRGKLPAYKTPGRHRRIVVSDLLSFLRKYKMPVPEWLVQEGAERKRVLIVDDEPQVTRMLGKAFSKRSGLEVRTVNDGIEALVLVGKWVPDLVVLDVVMPVVDGLRVCASLKSDPQTKNIRIIAISGKRLSDSSRQFLQRHADAYFTKPFDVMEMVDTALRLLGASPDRVKVG